eukprot:6186968-Pleurochrysis_carterae.AAC.16
MIYSPLALDTASALTTAANRSEYLPIHDIPALAVASFPFARAKLELCSIDRLVGCSLLPVSALEQYRHSSNHKSAVGHQ